VRIAVFADITSTSPVTFSQPVLITSTSASVNLASTVVSVGTAAGTILAAAAGRLFASFRHVNTGTVYIGYHMVPTVTNYSAFLNPGDYIEFNLTNLFRGTFNAISSTYCSSIAVASW